MFFLCRGMTVSEVFVVDGSFYFIIHFEDKDFVFVVNSVDVCYNLMRVCKVIWGK